MVGVLAHRHRCFQCELPVVDGFKGQQQGHHLGDGSNGHLLIGVFFVQHRTGVLIHPSAVPKASANSQKHRTPAHSNARFLRSIPVPSPHDLVCCNVCGSLPANAPL